MLIKTKSKAYCFRVFTMLSCVFNALLGGMAYQSFSVRNWEWKRQGRYNLVYPIDYVLGEYHCLNSWVSWRIARDNIRKLRKEYRDAEEKYYITQW